MTAKELTSIDVTRNIKQSNRLVEAKYRLTTYEQRMVIAICSQLKNNDDSCVIRIKANDLADFCKFEPKKKNQLVRTTARKLRGRTLEFQKPDGGWYITGWVNYAEYLEDGTIEFELDRRLKPQLLNLKSAYLSTPAAPLMEFKRDYSPRLYFLLKKMLKIKDFEYNLDFLRERFQLSKSYQTFANLKNKVIEPALTEINEISDIKVEYEYIKEGRSFTKIHFTVTLKKEPSKEEQLETETGQLRLGGVMSDSVQELTDKLIKRGVSAGYAKQIAKKYDSERIIRNLNLALKQKNNNNTNFAGLIVHFIKEDIAGQNAQAKAEVKKREQEREADARQAYELFHDKVADQTGDYEPPVVIDKKTGKIVKK